MMSAKLKVKNVQMPEEPTEFREAVSRFKALDKLTADVGEKLKEIILAYGKVAAARSDMATLLGSIPCDEAGRDPLSIGCKLLIKYSDDCKECDTAYVSRASEVAKTSMEECKRMLAELRTLKDDYNVVRANYANAKHKAEKKPLPEGELAASEEAYKKKQKEFVDKLQEYDKLITKHLTYSLVSTTQTEIHRSEECALLGGNDHLSKPAPVQPVKNNAGLGGIVNHFEVMNSLNATSPTLGAASRGTLNKQLQDLALMCRQPADGEK